MVQSQSRVLTFPEVNALFLVQADVAAVEGDDFCLNIGAAGVRGRVHVGDQADGGQGRISGDRAVHIAVFVDAGIRNAHFQHFLHQLLAQQTLLGGGGAGFGKFIGGSLVAYIAQEALHNRFH